MSGVQWCEVGSVLFRLVLTGGEQTMMTLSPAMMAEQAAGYFKREDYYLGGSEAGSTRWYGRGGRGAGVRGASGGGGVQAALPGRGPGGEADR